jgi:hypothetical protein
MHSRFPTDSVVLWYYDNTPTSGGYFLVNSTDDSLLRRAKEAFERLEISCRKEGICFRPANNGRQYKKFIRLLDRTGRCPDPRTVRKAIQPLVEFHFDASPSEVRRYFNWLHDRIDELEMEVKELRAAFDKSAKAPEERSDLEKMYESDVSRLQSELCQVREERERLLKRCTVLETELAHLHAEVSQRVGGAIEGIDECSTILRCLLPNIELIDGSLSYMLTEVKDYRHVLRFLYRLNGGEKLPFKVFRSAEGWFEVNKPISNGQSNKTRLYYRCHPISKKVQVLVSDKDEQDNDGRRLQRVP